MKRILLKVNLSKLNVQSKATCIFFVPPFSKEQKNYLKLSKNVQKLNLKSLYNEDMPSI